MRPCFDEQVIDLEEGSGGLLINGSVRDTAHLTGKVDHAIVDNNLAEAFARFKTLDIDVGHFFLQDSFGRVACFAMDL